MESVLALARTLRTTVGGERVWRGLRPVYWKTMSLLAGRRGTRLTLSDGQVYRIDPAFYAWSVDQYETELVRTLTTSLRSDSVLYDIGAHVGFITLMAARRLASGRGRVIAIEPAAANFTMLRRHVDINELSDRVTTLQSLVGETPAAAVPFVSKPEQFTANSLAYAIDGGETTPTPMTSVDRLVADGHAPPTHLKIDVEGYEGFVLRGARATLARYRPLVICAFHPEPLALLNESGAAIVGFMRELGYSAQTLTGEPSATPGFEELVFSPTGVGR
jgi:FkbM family methyltransferase